MEKRAQIIRDFFAIKPYIDQANKLANEKTELQFAARVSKEGGSLELIAFTSAHPNASFVLLCKTSKDYWIPAEETGFFDLKEYCAKELNRITRKKNEKNKLDIKSLGPILARKLGTLLIEDDSSL